MFESQFTLNNYLGCMIGGAIGDALGASIEFLSIDDIILSYGDKGVSDYVEFPDNIGEFTDDTQLALFTAEGILRYCSNMININEEDTIGKFVFYSYLRWLKTQGLGVDSINYIENQILSGWLFTRRELYSNRAPGNTCLISLLSGKTGSINNPINHSKGSGGVMRVAPVGLLYANAESAFDTAADIAAITHGHPTGYLSAGFFASVISRLTNGLDLMSSIQETLIVLEKYDGNQETLTSIKKAISLWKQYKDSQYPDAKSLSKKIELLGAGWIGEEALSISLFCSLMFEYDYAKGVLASINHSGDSDTTGSITGNILGLINRLETIPKKWIDNLRYCDIVKTIGEDIYRVRKSSNLYFDETWREKYPFC